MVTGYLGYGSYKTAIPKTVSGAIPFLAHHLYKPSVRAIVHITIVYRVKWPVRFFKTNWFVRFARRQRIKDSDLCAATERAEQGAVDGDIGGGVIKLRVARKGQGRSGGYRLLLAYRSGNRTVFLYGFAKNERDNIDDGELTKLKEIAAGWLNADSDHIEAAIKEGIL